MQKAEVKKLTKLKINLQWLHKIKNWIDLFLVNKRKIKQKRVQISNNQHFIGLIHRAKLDLEQSKNFFANVTDPDLIDYASHKILANQSFYAYLIKKAKAGNVTSDV